MYYIYLLKSTKNQHIYIGYTSDLKKRIKEHTEGKTYTTKRFLPMNLVYYEAFKSMADAKNRERQLKQYGAALGHLKRRIKDSI